jgi:hypothetical protein
MDYAHGKVETLGSAGLGLGLSGRRRRVARCRQESLRGGIVARQHAEPQPRVALHKVGRGLRAVNRSLGTPFAGCKRKPATAAGFEGLDCRLLQRLRRRRSAAKDASPASIKA